MRFYGFTASQKTMTAAARLQKQAAKHKFLIVELEASRNERFPRPVFACETLGEASRICQKMNADAGHDKFIVRANTADKK